MRVINFILVACLALALFQAAAYVLLLLVVTGFILCLFERPRETLALGLLLAILGLIQASPGTFFALVALLIAACLIGKGLERRRY
jgi:hypothetical protein